jgi:hypothetical protein
MKLFLFCLVALAVALAVAEGKAHKGKGSSDDCGKKPHKKPTTTTTTAAAIEESDETVEESDEDTTQRTQPGCPVQSSCPSACPQQQPVLTVTCNCQYPTGIPVTVTEAPTTTTTVATTTTTMPPAPTTIFTTTAATTTTTTTDVPEDVRNDTAVPCNQGVNLAIVLDGSGSIARDDFARAKDFVKLLAGAFGKPSNVSVIVFSYSVDTIIPLHNTLTAYQVNATIDAIIQPRGTTQTDKGIATAVAELQAVPVTGPRKMLVLTDGYSNNSGLTKQEADKAKAAGIESYSIGIGPSLSDMELLSIAGDDTNRVLKVQSFTDLQQLVGPISHDLCIDP